ncbi:MAG: molybdopterin-dependent oxidoreductase, partial [Bryobacterales bacterium]|nr:molybdopterin-dependent oxidoreductase [Bryobacterales bacterium]
MKNWKRLLGIDTLREQYAYTDDAVLGHTSAHRSADRWVKSTCGYCSVGCGMELGVRDNRVVAIKGWDAHPVSGGKLCPKGLSEHHMLTAPDRALYPMMRRRSTMERGGMERATWSHALRTMTSEFRRIQNQHGPGAVGVISTGQLLTEEFYTLGKLVQLGLGTSNYCGNTTLCMASAVSGYKRSFGSDGP